MGSNVSQTQETPRIIQVQMDTSNASYGNNDIVEQWVDKVLTYSSQYDNVKWPANAILGHPKVYPKYGDIPGAWAQGSHTLHHSIEIMFKEKVYIEQIDIYETYHAGGVEKIVARKPDYTLHTVWETSKVSDIRESRIFSPPFEKLTFPCDTLIIYTSSAACRSWVELDAVKIIGTRRQSPSKLQLRPKAQPVPEKTDRIDHWVSRVITWSSQYDAENYSAFRVMGEPKVYPEYGDLPGAWAPGIKNNNQFLLLEFPEKLYIEKVDIYETYHAGGVKCIQARKPNGQMHTIYSTALVADIPAARIFSPPFQKLTFPCNVLHITIDCTASGSWVEIDAVKITGTRTPSAAPPQQNPLSLPPPSLAPPKTQKQPVTRHMSQISGLPQTQSRVPRPTSAPKQTERRLPGSNKPAKPTAPSSSREPSQAPLPPIQPPSTGSGNKIQQYVSRVVNFSSQYDSHLWGAQTIIGEPRVYPQYGDIQGAWAQKNWSPNEFIEVEFAEKTSIEKIEIFETYNAGGVKRILAKRPNGEWFTVWETDKCNYMPSSRIFTPSFKKLNFMCSILRVEVDCSACNNWVEIDAIKVTGTKFLFGPIEKKRATTTGHIEGCWLFSIVDILNCSLYEIPEPNENLPIDMAKLVNNPLFSDVQFRIGNATFYGHKAILFARSSYFSSYFKHKKQAGKGSGVSSAPMTNTTNDLGQLYNPPPPSYDSSVMPELVLPAAPDPAEYDVQGMPAVIEIKDISIPGFQVVLYYVYTNRLPKHCPANYLPGIWRAAERFILEDLKTLLMYKLSEVMTVDNVIPIYQDIVSSPLSTNQMKEYCEEFMKSNITNVVTQRSFEQLPKEMLIQLTKMMTSQ